MRTLLLFLSLLCACTSAPRPTPKAPTPAQQNALAEIKPQGWEVTLNADQTEGHLDILLNKEGGPIALDLQNIVIGDCRKHAATLANLKKSGAFFDTQLNASGDALLIEPKALGGGIIRAQLTFTPPGDDGTSPCRTFAKKQPTLHVIIQLWIDSPRRTVLEHPNNKDRVGDGGVFHTLPGASVDIRYSVETQLDRNWHNIKNKSDVIFPDHSSANLVLTMPADGEKTILSSKGERFTFKTVAFDALKEMELLLSQRLRTSLKPIKDQAKVQERKTVYIHLFKLNAEHPINFLNRELSSHLTITSKTQNVCIALPTLPERRPANRVYDYVTSPNSGSDMPVLGAMEIKTSGTCTFTVTLGSTSKTQSFEILP